MLHCLNSLRKNSLRNFAILSLYMMMMPVSVSAEEESPKETLLSVQENIAKIKPEVERLSSQKSLLEREKMNLSERLVIITEKVRAAQERIDMLEDDIKTADMREQALTGDLSTRKTETAKILAAMGRLSILPSSPLGAVEDEQKTVHTALLLRNMTTELKKRADALVSDIELLRSMREQLKVNRRNLANERLVLSSDSERLKILIETRQNNIQKTGEDLKETRQKLLALSKEEKTIEGLIEKIRLENQRKDAAQEAKKQAEIEQAKKLATYYKNQDQGKGKDPLPEPPVVQKNTHKDNEAVQLLSESEYVASKGRLLRPIAGKVIQQFGMRDKTGKERRGITIQSKSGDIVTAPINARVIFADNFKRQGSIIILNPVGKYYIVLSGLGVINVSPGQYVAMGEPIGQMKSGIGQRNLYVEFRKDRSTIDPNPWLSQSTNTQLAKIN